MTRIPHRGIFYNEGVQRLSGIESGKKSVGQGNTGKAWICVLFQTTFMDRGKSQMTTDTVKVIGMTCSGCANSVANALNNVLGVQRATVDLREEQATIVYDSTLVKIEDLKRAIEDAGYETA